MATVTLLFVCHGNTCRSPMAEGLAKKLLGGQAYVESAGTEIREGRAAADAVAVLAQEYGVDISMHHPRSVYDLPLDIYDWIIAIDGNIYDDLYGNFPKHRARLIRWEIEDPYRRGEAVYRQTAATIEMEIRALAAQLGMAVIGPASES